MTFLVVCFLVVTKHIWSEFLHTYPAGILFSFWSLCWNRLSLCIYFVSESCWSPGNDALSLNSSLSSLLHSFPSLVFMFVLYMSVCCLCFDESIAFLLSFPLCYFHHHHQLDHHPVWLTVWQGKKYERKKLLSLSISFLSCFSGSLSIQFLVLKDTQEEAKTETYYGLSYECLVTLLW